MSRRPSSKSSRRGSRNGKRSSNQKVVKSTDSNSRRGTGVRIAPSLLAADFTNLAQQIRTIRSLALPWLHLDIMDGHFVPNISYGPDIVRQARSMDRSLYFDCHLMISDPRRYVKDFVDAGVQNLTFHVEAAEDDSANLLKYIRRQGIQAGVSIKPRTRVNALEECLPFADLVLVMTVEPGFGGQEMIPSTLNKVRELVLLREELGLEYLVEVDGGIDPKTAPLAVAAGADVLVAGSAIFGRGRIRENTRELRNSMKAVC